jgi:predicted RNA-binding protein with RPS1 domain
MTKDCKYKKGNIVKGIVSGVEKYGIFVKIDDEYSGLIHISEISDKYVQDPKKFAEKDDVIHVEILDIDNKSSQMKLSIKNIEYKEKVPKRKKRIVETEHGFKTLAKQLPIWIEENINSIRK